MGKNLLVCEQARWLGWRKVAEPRIWGLRASRSPRYRRMRETAGGCVELLRRGAKPPSTATGAAGTEISTRVSDLACGRTTSAPRSPRRRRAWNRGRGSKLSQTWGKASSYADRRGGWGGGKCPSRGFGVWQDYVHRTFSPTPPCLKPQARVEAVTDMGQSLVHEQARWLGRRKARAADLACGRTTSLRSPRRSRA
jgi:hypothetical protein